MRWDFINTYVHLYINIYCILDERTRVRAAAFIVLILPFVFF